MTRKSDLIDDFQKLAADEKAAGPAKTASNQKLISLEQEDEVHSWCESLGCTREELQQAVETVGRSADEVRRFLSYRRQ
ncbi:MAG: DUF3606 domain-containing protein [Proteobacteria bacterium]|nr:DUF3606 domain-containing protein [Pseudomonadota bacterium]